MVHALEWPKSRGRINGDHLFALDVEQTNDIWMRFEASCNSHFSHRTAFRIERFRGDLLPSYEAPVHLTITATPEKFLRLNIGAVSDRGTPRP